MTIQLNARPSIRSGSRVRRAATRPSRQHSPEELEFERAWQRAVSDVTEVVPTRQEQSARRSWWSVRVASRVTRGAIAVAAVSATLLGSAVLATGAYFTTVKNVGSNTSTSATVKVGLTNTSGTTTWTTSGLLPLSDTDAAATTSPKGVIVPVQLTNNGSLTADWSLTVNPVTATASDLLPYVKVALSTDGTTYTAPYSLSDTGTPVTATGASLAAAGVKTVNLRFFLASNTPNRLKGTTVPFTISAKIIQTGVSMTNPNAAF